MGLKNICTTQETSRKLKEAGFPQEGGIAYWFFPADYVQEQKWGLVPEYATGQEGEYIRAFTFSELWEILPNQIFNPINERLYLLRLYPRFIGYYPLDKSKELREEDYKRTTPQEAAAELALWCVKEGYLNPKEGG